MKAHRDLSPQELEALSRALALFLADRIEEGRAELDKLPAEVLEWAYTGGLRLGIEAHATAARRQGSNKNDGQAVIGGL
ncbi:MAG: hypothetical protein P4L83_21880 [Nevskia sp.]|nr:hypothetical protein [Nevskia sp.]